MEKTKIEVRMTHRLKEQIRVDANSLDRSLSQYVIDCVLYAKAKNFKGFMREDMK